MLGDDVGFNVTDPDKVYASVIFIKNRHKVDGLQLMYPNAEIDIGGTGYDLHKHIPQIDLLKPDYTLYPKCDYSVGFTTRGCVRHCYFCFVPAKEGKFKIVQHPREFYDPSKKKILFMDNNILANKDWFMEVTDFVIKNKLQADFNQGLDVRLLDHDIAKRIAQMKPINDWKFAFDDLQYQNEVFRGITLLKEAGVNVRHSVRFFVYCDNDSQYDDAVSRCRMLKDRNVTPFVMLNQQTVKTQRMKDLQRWGCRPWVTWSCDISVYRTKINVERTTLENYMEASQ
jgi:hypothetical protein